MIGRQSSILLTQLDFYELAKRMIDRGDVRMLADAVNESRTSLLPLALSTPRVGDGKAFWSFLAPTAWDPVVEIDLPSDVKHAVRVDESELIELGRCYCTDSEIRRSRIFYTPSFLEDGVMRDKNERFVSWAQRVVASFRKSLTYEKGLLSHVGPDAAARIASGQLTVIP